jgi:FkbM family methyltransferase
VSPRFRSTVKAAARRVGYEERLLELRLALTRRGRRGLKDDRQLAFLLTALLRPDSNCIDVGANKGAILRQIVRCSPHGHHLAFEPLPSEAAELRAAFPDVELHELALADTDGDATFHVAAWGELSGLQTREWLSTTYETITVPVRRLDSVVSSDRPVAFLKVDVEGAQVLVLRGAQELLARDRPVLWIEHGARSAGAHDTTSRDLWELLSAHGYRIWTADGQGPLDLKSFEVANDMPMWTFMAHV